MIQEGPTGSRQLQSKPLDADIVFVGGGLAGTCGAIAAARGGLKVVLVQDRPALGGNASSEVRLWVLGATSHMGNNNRWSREGGIINETLEENLYRNRQGNGLIFDTILLEKVIEEPKITLMTHPEEVVPFMVKDFDLLDGAGKVVRSVRDHRGASHEWRPEQALTTKRLTLRVLATHGAPAAVFRVSCFSR